MPQLDLFGNESSASGKKSTRKSIKHDEGELVEHINEHPDIDVNSDDNVLRHVETVGKIHTYKYIRSQTKMGKMVTFTNEGLANFIESNSRIRPVEPLPAKVLRKKAIRLQK